MCNCSFCFCNCIIICCIWENMRLICSKLMSLVGVTAAGTGAGLFSPSTMISTVFDFLSPLLLMGMSIAETRV